jgi:hypothetical protein
MREEKIRNKSSVAKQALLAAIKKAGNCNKLATLLDVNNGMVYKWLYKKYDDETKDLMHHESAYKIQKAVKIKNLASKLCPSIKKIKKY